MKNDEDRQEHGRAGKSLKSKGEEVHKGPDVNRKETVGQLIGRGTKRSKHTWESTQIKGRLHPASISISVADVAIIVNKVQPTTGHQMVIAVMHRGHQSAGVAEIMDFNDALSQNSWVPCDVWENQGCSHAPDGCPAAGDGAPARAAHPQGRQGFTGRQQLCVSNRFFLIPQLS